VNYELVRGFQFKVWLTFCDDHPTVRSDFGDFPSIGEFGFDMYSFLFDLFVPLDCQFDCGESCGEHQAKNDKVEQLTPYTFCRSA
jgi:hypothetical protein